MASAAFKATAARIVTLRRDHTGLRQIDWSGNVFSKGITEKVIYEVSHSAFKSHCTGNDAPGHSPFEVDLQSLTPRERRRLRASRRREKLEIVQVDSTAEEEPSLPKKETKLGPVSKSDFFELEHLRRLGDQWYILQIMKVNQEQTVERIHEMFAERFPELKYELFFPTFLEGSKSSPQKVFVEPEAIFIRLTMTDAVHKALYRMPRVRLVFGRLHKRGQANVTIPSPVPETSIQNLRQIVEEGNKRFQESKEEVEFSTHSNESPVISELIPEKAKKKESIRKFLTPGTKVRILKGPFRNFKADVVELVPRQRKVVANVEVLGQIRTLQLNTDFIELVTEEDLIAERMALHERFSGQKRESGRGRSFYNDRDYGDDYE